jgi:hypothetical protein
MQNHEREKMKNQDSTGKTNFFPSTMPYSPWVVLAKWSSSKNTGKMNLRPVFNKNSPWAHTESDLDVLGVYGKLVKYVVHLSKRKN